MVDYPDWMKDAALKMSKDRCHIILRTMSWAAVLLIATAAPVSEREELMELADDVSELQLLFLPSCSNKQMGMKPEHIEYFEKQNTRINEPKITESERLARLSEIENRFQKLCIRNNIAPDKPVPEEAQEDVNKVFTEIKQAIKPILLSINDLEETRTRIWKSLSGDSDIIAGVEEYHRLAGEITALFQLYKMISFLGPDAVDLDQSGLP